MTGNTINMVLNVKAINESLHVMEDLVIEAELDKNPALINYCDARDALSEKLDRFVREAEKCIANEISVSIDNAVESIEQDFLREFSAFQFSKKSAGKEKTKEAKENLCNVLASLLLAEAVIEE